LSAPPRARRRLAIATLAIEGDELVVALSALVSGGHRPGLRLDFAEGSPCARLVMSCADPQEQAELVRRAQRGP
jgi:hypothetical protein